MPRHNTIAFLFSLFLLKKCIHFFVEGQNSAAESKGDCQ
ncbi:hypothetical protein NMS_1980 [Nonlabens marinus S1-08]|uniref:Uncharacterized protein n=1 Tax=Nonlabens marinus S1-08 TaxID=1454201 RepID=W8VQZ4_9FLAO|nr:hypothetical protein NMS_1980 [Nonlabens marinus S1-08]